MQEAGLLPFMAAAIAEKHDWVAGLARDGAFDGVACNAPWQDWADRVIRHAAAS